MVKVDWHRRIPHPVLGAGVKPIRLFRGHACARRSLGVRIERVDTWYRYEKGSEIIALPATGREVYFITSGAVRVRIYSEAGRQVSFRDMDAGAIIGDIAAIDGAGRSTDITALVESVLAALLAAAFMLLLREQHVMYERYLSYLTGLIRLLTARVPP